MGWKQWHGSVYFPPSILCKLAPIALPWKLKLSNFFSSLLCGLCWQQQQQNLHHNVEEHYLANYSPSTWKNCFLSHYKRIFTVLLLDYSTISATINIYVCAWKMTCNFSLMQCKRKKNFNNWIHLEWGESLKSSWGWIVIKGCKKLKKKLDNKFGCTRVEN